MNAQLDFMETIAPEPVAVGPYHWAVVDYEQKKLEYEEGHVWWRIMGGIPHGNPWAFEPAPFQGEWIHKPIKTFARLKTHIGITQAALKVAISTYLDLCNRGTAALSDYDKRDDAFFALASALTGRANHICWNRAKLRYLNQLLVKTTTWKTCK